jgi:hypothetical protein
VETTAEIVAVLKALTVVVMLVVLVSVLATAAG